ncbi:hypothetical protein KW803_00555 [Candidatus Saccharibacteria bacterium]|nr:hypothetical protein [Candidatus Saccharibacteria bacterium]
MNKMLLYGCIFLGGIIGSYIPALWHAGVFSAAGLIGGVIGSIVGWWAARYINNMFDI